MKSFICLLSFIIVCSLFQASAQAQNNLQKEIKSSENSLLSQQASQISSQDKVDLLWNIERIIFRNPSCGPLKITNLTSSSDIIKVDGNVIMAASKYGQGRAVTLASQQIFRENTLKLDKNFIFLLRNIIKWVGRQGFDTYQILAIGIPPSRKYQQLLMRSGLSTSFTFVYDLIDVGNLTRSRFQAILIGDLSLEFLKQTDAQKISQYVLSGGGVLSTFRHICHGCYLQLKQCTQAKKQCLHNRVFNPMGIKFDNSDKIQVPQIQFTPQQTAELGPQQLRVYQKNTNQMFDSSVNHFEKYIEDYRSITDGVIKLQYGGATFNSFAYSWDQYFPIAYQNYESNMVAGRFGAGKLFFAGHGTLFSSESSGNLKLVSNIVRWLSGTKAVYKIGFLFDIARNYPVFDKIPEKFSKFQINYPSELQGKDIICVPYFGIWPSKLTAKMLDQLKKYVRNGGNMIFASPGWIWSYYGAGSTNKTLKYQQSFASFVIAKQFNVFLKQQEGGLSDPYIINQLQKSSELEDFLYNDFYNVLAFQEQFEASNQKIEQYIKQIESQLIFQNICDVSFYHEIVEIFLESRFNIESNFNKINATVSSSNYVYKLMNALSYAVSPLQCRALPPSLNIYPGYAKDRVDSKTIKVFRNINQRVYTGLYMNPGQAIKIRYNNSTSDLSGIQLLVNHHEPLYGANRLLQRFPVIHHKFQIKASQFLISSPHGGFLYFVVKSKSTSTLPLIFQIEGAYLLPYFNQKTDTSNSFLSIQKIQAPFFIFETLNMVIIGPTKGIYSSLIINVKKLCSYWNTVSRTYKQFRGISLYPFLKDSIFNDITIAAGSMHSGNPVQTFEDVTLTLIGWQNIIYKVGHWGIYHQLGHNHQDWKWTVQSTVEVTCNIFSLYLNQKMHGITVFHNSSWMMDRFDRILLKFENYMTLSDSEKMLVYSKDARFALYLYAILIEQFGFGVFSILHKRYDQLNINPETEEDKFNILVQQLSKIVKKNLWKYFKNWGMPVTQASRDKITDLPQYQCRRHPILTQ